MAIETRPYIPVNVSIPKAHFSLEGIDGVGKTTQILRISGELLLREVDFQIGKSPSSSPLGEFLRYNIGSLKTWERNTLFLIDMIAILKDNEGTGKTLIWDRYKDSNRVANKDMTPEEADMSVACLPETTRTFLLDMNPQLIISGRNDSLHGHSLDLDWQREKRRRYLDLAETHSPRIIVVDATQKEEVISQYIANNIVKDLQDLELL